jgi:hypothetical protein
VIWFAVDDSFESHEKVLALDPELADAALALWVLAGSWVGRQLTDGFVPQSYVTRADKQHGAAELVRVGLWQQVPGGYQFTNFHRRNPSREQVLGSRAKDAERKRKAREVLAQKRGASKAESARTSGVESDVESCRESALTRPDPTRPKQLRSLPPNFTYPASTPVLAAAVVNDAAAPDCANVLPPPRRPSRSLDAQGGSPHAAAYALVRQLQVELPQLANFDVEGWSDDWCWLAARPTSERTQVIATLKASSWAKAQWRRCNPAHLRKYWSYYAAGEEPGQRPGSRKSVARVSSREDFLRAIAAERAANDNGVQDE